MRATSFSWGPAGGDESRVHVYRLADVGNAEAAPVQTLTVTGLDGFGDAMAASGTDLMVTGTNTDGGRALATFRRGANGRWSQRGTLALDGRAGFGGAGIALNGNLLAAGNPSAGTVSVFERVTEDGEWGEPAELTRPGSDEDTGAFGMTIAAHGGEVLVAEMRVERSRERGVVRTGAVHRFVKIDGAWTAVGALPVEEGESEGGFGSSLAVHGGTLLVGDGNRVFAYTRQNGGWSPAGSSPLADTGDGGRPMPFQTVALGDGIAALGYPGADFGMGAVTVLANESGEWVSAARLVAEHAPLPAITGGEIACADGEAAAYDCDHVDLLSFLPREEIGTARGARLNDIWGLDRPGDRAGVRAGRPDGRDVVRRRDRPLQPPLPGQPGQDRGGARPAPGATSRSSGTTPSSSPTGRESTGCRSSTSPFSAT